MRLPAERLADHLARGLAPAYLVFGEEPLLIAEAGDAIRASARERGYDERLVFVADTGFDWNTLKVEAFSPSLFSARRLLELRLETAPGEAGSPFITHYAAQPPADCLLLVTAGKLDSRAQKTRWFQALEQVALLVPVRPVPAARLPDWIKQRLQAKGFQSTPEAASLLAERVEGNLLAAAQELEKLRLLHRSNQLDVEDVLDAVGDSARYTVYDLADAALDRDPTRVVRILRGVRAEGLEPPLVLWALARELRVLLGLSHDLESGRRLEQSLTQRGVRELQKPRVRAALAGRTWSHFRRLLQRAARCDRVIKGVEPGDPWDELLALAVGLAGPELPSAAAVG